MDYSYLRPPKKVRELCLPPNSIMRVVDGRPLRKIFYEVSYTTVEQELIDRLKAHLSHIHHQHAYDDAMLLKFCVAGDFDLPATMEKIRLHEEWKANLQIQTMSIKALRILEEGAVYSYGRDFYYRPIVVVSLQQINSSNYDLQEYYCAINTLIKVIVEYMFVPGKVENIIVIVDASQLNLPISAITTSISKLTAAFPATLERLFIVNASQTTTKLFDLVKKVVPLVTLRKIQMLSPKQLDHLLRYLPSDELQKKFGGTLPNLSEFWPIKSTNKIITDLDTQKSSEIHNDPDQEEVESLHSVMNNSQFFKDAHQEKQQTEMCCCAKQSCRLF